MKIAKKVFKWILYFLLIPIAYIIIALLLTSITVERSANEENRNQQIYLNTNGIHLDIIIPIKNTDSLVLAGIKYNANEKYLSFGWGDENFYIHTPTWGDLTFSNAFKAMFLKSSTLMHVTRYNQKQSDWIAVKINEAELSKLNNYLLNTFDTNESGTKIILENKGYYSNDDFYKAIGNYTCFKTCNSWVNIGFKESALKSCLWTPFD